MKARQLYWSVSNKCSAGERNFALHFRESSCNIFGFRVTFCMAEWNCGSNIVYYLSLRFWTLFHGTIIVYQHLANCMKSRTEETRRFPFMPLSVSDWLIRKHHPITDEQTAFGAVRVGLNEKSALINQIQRRIWHWTRHATLLPTNVKIIVLLGLIA